jgi:ABC-type multidrug transport system fused ATPase/permease subunit
VSSSGNIVTHHVREPHSQLFFISPTTEMKRFLGEDEGGENTEDGRDSPSGIIVETLLNIRTVSALTLEEQRYEDYKQALTKAEGDLVKESAISGILAGLAVGIQQWVNALQFWWGGWLVSSSSLRCCCHSFLRTVVLNYHLSSLFFISYSTTQPFLALRTS